MMNPEVELEQGDGTTIRGFLMGTIDGDCHTPTQYRVGYNRFTAEGVVGCEALWPKEKVLFYAEPVEDEPT